MQYIRLFIIEIIGIGGNIIEKNITADPWFKIEIAPLTLITRNYEN